MQKKLFVVFVLTVILALVAACGGGGGSETSGTGGGAAGMPRLISVMGSGYWRDPRDQDSRCSGTTRSPMIRTTPITRITEATT